MGQAMMEETSFHDGLPLHANFLDYRVPTILDSPNIHTHIVESIDPNGPFGAKEASEGGLAGFPPALVQAVHEAIGIEFNELPLTPSRIIDALKKARRKTRRKTDPEARRETHPDAGPALPGAERAR
jgi:4-hydroxybenzoyl-CoA reductase subunit alpha